MGTVARRVLRAVLAVAFAGSLVVQIVIVPLLWADLAGAPGPTRTAVVVIAVLGVVTLQVVAAGVWRLLTLVARGTVFSSAAFRYVDLILVAVCAASLLLFGLGIVLAPGEAVAPGVVALVGGAGVVAAGVALVIVVLRTLLAQAVALDDRARTLQAELNEVI